MTVNQLHKRLTKLIAEGFARNPVCVSKTTFTHNCEGDGVTILPVTGVGIRRINIASDDGGTGYNKDGSERTKMTVILSGIAGSNAKGGLIEVSEYSVECQNCGIGTYLPSGRCDHCNLHHTERVNTRK